MVKGEEEPAVDQSYYNQVKGTRYVSQIKEYIYTVLTVSPEGLRTGDVSTPPPVVYLHSSIRRAGKA